MAGWQTNTYSWPESDLTIDNMTGFTVNAVHIPYKQLHLLALKLQLHDKGSQEVCKRCLNFQANLALTESVTPLYDYSDQEMGSIPFACK